MDYIKRIIKCIVWIPRNIRIASEPTYYPELKRKTKISRFFDLTIWLLSTGEVNKFYNLYGLDTIERSHKKETYCDYRFFMKTRDAANGLNRKHHQTVLLRDKYLFYKYMTSCGFSVPAVFAVLRDGKLYDNTMKLTDEAILKDRKDYFVKEINGECASFVMHIHDYEEYKNHYAEISKRNCIFQERLFQCEKMNTLNPCAINTVRMVTVKKQEEVYLFAAEIRIGTKKTGEVDNASAGGICVGVSESGCLKKNGFRKMKYGGKTLIHPDTGIVFETFQIPYYDKAINTICDAHRCFYNVHSIGWDVAITEEGPVFIEGNDNWEISGIQSCNGGLKKEWLEAIN